MKDVLLVVPLNLKKKIINEINSQALNNTKVTTFEEIRENLYFKYDEKSIHYIMKNYKINYDLAQIYLENLYFIEDKKYNNSKLDNLVKIKKELELLNLIFKNDYYKSFLKSKKIVIKYYNLFNLYQKKIINELKKITDVEIIEPENKYDVKICHEFNNMIEEITYVFENISTLIENKIDINEISILNVTNDYLNTISLISEFYNIPISLPNKSYLFGTKISAVFLETLYKTNNIEDALLSIKDTSLYDKFIDICNKYIWCKDEYLIKMLEHELKTTEIQNIEYTNSITVNEPKKYNFLIGFNNNYPKVLHDDEYLSDKVKKTLKYNTSYELNTINRKQKIYELKNIPNLTISYSLKSLDVEYFKSSLIEEMQLEIIRENSIISKYSDKVNKYNLIRYLDLYTKYGYMDKDLAILYNKYKIKYLSYDNKFTGINKDELSKFLNNKLTLSYTSLNNYYNCKFKYYVNDLLKINPNDEQFHLIIGNLYHHVLSCAFKEKFDLDKCANEYIENLNRKFSYKEKFFLKKLTQNLCNIIEEIKAQKKYTNLDEALYEKQIFIDKSNNIKITFMGVVDKILYKKENNKTYAIVIDYKTGNPNTSLDNIEFGIDMQLPIYLYLINKEFENVNVIGMYYQKLLHKIPNITDNKEQIKNNYKLIGYTIDKEELINKIDSTYEDSLLIKGMKKGKNGFYSNTKLLNEQKIKDILNLVDNKIDNCIEGIINGDFQINPKKINTYSSCEKCIYNNICYRKEKDFIYLEKEE